MARLNRTGTRSFGGLGNAVAVSAAVHIILLVVLSAERSVPSRMPALADDSEFDIVLLNPQPTLPKLADEVPDHAELEPVSTSPDAAASTDTIESQSDAKVPEVETVEPSPQPRPDNSKSVLSMRTTSVETPAAIRQKEPVETNKPMPLPRWLRGNAPSNRIRDALARVELEEPTERNPLAPLVGPRKPRSLLRPTTGNQHRTDDTTFVATTRSDGTVKFDDQGGFDVTDAAMRLAGQDPYVSRKLKFLDSTRDERAQIASVNKQADLADASRQTRARLLKIFRRKDLTWPQKRSIYFELWDECSETGSEGEREASASVRATIVGFIKKKLPRTSVHTFTAAELAGLNRRRESKAVFRPYPER